MQAILHKKMKLFRNQKGLTLVELLAVIVILGVVAAIAVPAIGGTIEKSKTNADARSKELLADAAVRYAIDNNPGNVTGGTPAAGAVTQATLKSAGYLREEVTKQSGAGGAFTITLAYSTTTGWTATVN